MTKGPRHSETRVERACSGKALSSREGERECGEVESDQRSGLIMGISLEKVLSAKYGGGQPKRKPNPSGRDVRSQETSKGMVLLGWSIGCASLVRSQFTLKAATSSPKERFLMLFLAAILNILNCHG